MIKFFSISLIPFIIVFSLFNIENTNTSLKKSEVVTSISIEKKSVQLNVDYSFLKDNCKNYLLRSYNIGIGILKNSKTVEKYKMNKWLVELKNSDNYLIDTMEYSYPALTNKATILLNEIGKRFGEKIKNSELIGSKFHLTSALRTIQSVKKLKKKNRNAIKWSSHLHGTSFDLAYDDFFSVKELSILDLKNLKDILASVLIDLKKENKCWVTYEEFQSCFHVVSKM